MREDRRAERPPALTLIGKADCHLCHVMKAVAENVLTDFDGTLRERDLEADRALAERYRLDIPVLLLGEREVARHRISASELRERLIGLGLSPRAR